MSRNAILAIVIVLIVIVAGWWLLQSQKGAATPSPETTSTQPVVTAAPSSPTESTGVGMEQTAKNLVSISASGFSPQTITIKAGDEVTWVNNDTAMHTVNSDPHPIHTAYPPLNTVGRLVPGEKKSLKFPDPGTFKYHDHLNPSTTGTVVVQ